MSAQADSLTSDEASREALVRVLAGESRNALARVELAASELARLESTPSLKERVETIRSAVEEIDSLLGKIDLMAMPIARRECAGTDLGETVREVCTRLEPSIRARGITLVWPEIEPGRSVSAPRRALEGLLVGLFRVGLALGEGPEARLVLHVTSDDDHARFRLNAFRGANVPREIVLDREARIELEVALAEWGGGFLAAPNAHAHELGIELPLRASHD